MDDERSGLDLEQDDSLPWLEPVDDYDSEPGSSPVKLALVVIAGLAVIALAVFAVFWVQSNPRGGEGELIVAEQDDYKVPASNTEARTFEGEGDTSYAASEGNEPDGKIDQSLAPEAPAIGAAANNAPAKTATPTTTPAKPVEEATASAPVATGSVTLQLGAFASRKGADTAWTSLTKRIPALTGYAPAISSASVGGGTVYRLRTTAKSKTAAARLCEAVRAKGENCLVVG
ncbi:SPOR domain-containing protein [Sphingorhabdus soli]|uniref:SPOR domain-containing protein n=1 Tax=Flavisphingopyxis soli TaxID=2601267 RepID=A0A5C6U6U4_9SPHN|nr:SPOR domain-containing protein [Sphingorhabdus soli]TXC68713.1 SPOR domain-containing protein [Sphingorhabdus soli]